MIEVNVDGIITKVLYAMQSVLESVQLDKLKSALYINLGRVKAYEEETALATAMDDNNQVINLFLATLKIEGRTDSTIKAYTCEYKSFFSFIDKIFRDVTTNDVRMYLAHCKMERNNSDVTLNNRIRNLRSLFKWLLIEDYIEKNPMLKINQVKTEKRVKEVITDEQAEVIRCACSNKRDLAIVNLLSSTGMRVGELVGLNKSDIDFINSECIVFGKGRKERPVYFDGRAKVHLLEYIESREDDNEALFVSNKAPHGRLTTDGIRYIIKKIGRDTGIENLHIHPHKFRGTMATNMMNRGAAAEHVQQILGHTTVNTLLNHYVAFNKAVIKRSHSQYAI